MADDPKTRTLGKIDVKKVKTNEVWKKYEAASKAFADAKKVSKQAKDAMKDEFRKLVPALKDAPDNFDFTVQQGNITVFEPLKEVKISKVKELL
jgi:hypothetical protein